MTAPATAERTRAAAGAIPPILNAAAPDEKVEGVEDAAVEVPEVEPGVTDETGVVAVTEGVETVAGELTLHSTRHSLISKQSLTWSQYQ